MWMVRKFLGFQIFYESAFIIRKEIHIFWCRYSMSVYQLKKQIYSFPPIKSNNLKFCIFVNELRITIEILYSFQRIENNNFNSVLLFTN